MQTRRDKTRETQRKRRTTYEPPRVMRVAVETARLVTGHEFSDSHCTQHYHDLATCPW